jgi:hypothetical protein
MLGLLSLTAPYVAMFKKTFRRSAIIPLSLVFFTSHQALADVENCGWGAGSGEWECFSPIVIAALKPMVKSVKHNCGWFNQDAEAAEPPIREKPDFIEALKNCNDGYAQMSEGIDWCDLEADKLDTPRVYAETMCGEEVCEELTSFIEAHRTAYSFNIGKEWRASSEDINVTLVGVSQSCE